jgi:hypothetical protein
MLPNLARFITVLYVLVFSSLCFAEAPKYGTKEAEPRTGSFIKRNLTLGSPIPINRRYDELTSEEKASILQYYEAMEPSDEPPFPSNGLQPIYDAIQKAQALMLVTGEMLLFVMINAEGVATEVTAINSPSPDMTRFASSVLLLTKFKPALCKGQPCKMEYPFGFVFRVK